jgi:hypothetical protein
MGLLHGGRPSSFIPAVAPSRACWNVTPDDHNRLVGSSSPSSPTTHSDIRRDFPAVWQLAPNWPSCGVTSSLPRLAVNFSGCFVAFVSAHKIPFPGNRDSGSKRRGSNAGLGRPPAAMAGRVARSAACAHQQLSNAPSRVGHLVRATSTMMPSNRTAANIRQNRKVRGSVFIHLPRIYPEW